MLSKSTSISLASALPLLASLHTTLSAAVPAQKFPMMPRQTNSSNTGVSLPDTTKKFYANALCSPEKLQLELENWNDASLYAYALASWQANGSYQAAMDMYMGNDSRGPLGDILRSNIVGAANVHTQSTWPDKQRVFIICEEPAELMSEVAKQSKSICDKFPAVAYEFTELGKYFENHYIVFCPAFYDQPTLSQALALASGLSPDMEHDNIETLYGNQGAIYFHESLHLSDLTTPINHSIWDGDTKTPPAFADSIYGPYAVMKEAEEENTGACIHTADAYTCAAAAIFGQQLFDLAKPPTPPAVPFFSEKLARFPRQLIPGGDNMSSLVRPYFPDPDTQDNYIAINDLGFGPSTLII